MTRRRILTVAGGAALASVHRVHGQTTSPWSVDWHWNSMPMVPQLDGAMMTTWQTGILDRSRLVLLSAPRLMPIVQSATASVQQKGIVTLTGRYSDTAGTAMLIAQAIDHNTDPVHAHADMLSRLAPAYRLGKLLAVGAGKRSDLMAAARSVRRPEKCPNCQARTRIIPAQEPTTYAGCDFSDPMDTCWQGPYNTGDNPNAPQQNSLWYQGIVYAQQNNGDTSRFYEAPPLEYPSSPDPLSTSTYTPNLGQQQVWSYPADTPDWQGLQIQMTKAQQINFVAGVMGVIGGMWGLGALIAAGACPVCAGAAIGFGLMAAVIRLLNN